MAVDFNKFGKSTSVAQQPQQPTGATSTIQPVAPQPSTGKIDFNKFGKAGTGGTSQTVTEQPQEGGIIKSIVGAPATMLARPVQLGMAISGMTEDEIDATTKKYTGGIVAPVVRGQGEYGLPSLNDMTKEVGRAGQTIATGLTGAKTILAAGGMYGAGSSLERQGSDAFTTPEGAAQLVGETALGMAGGKLLDKYGKPIINKTISTVGKAVPQSVIDKVSSKAVKISDYMDKTQLPGVGKYSKPLSESITKGAETFDTGVNKAFKKGGDAISSAVRSQYPNASKSAQDYYSGLETGRFMEPATAPGATYSKAAETAKDAKRRGIDIEKVLKDNKIYAGEHVDDLGHFSTNDIADNLIDDTKNGSAEILRPALRKAEGESQRVSIEELRNTMLKNIADAPSSVLSPQQKIEYAQKVALEYGDDSITARAYKHGYTLEDLYNSKLQTTSNIYKTSNKGGISSISDSKEAERKLFESKVFDKFLRERAPKDLGLDDYFKANEARFVTANYLRTLDNKKAPQTLFHRVVKKAGQLAGATTGANVAGPFGMFSGYQFGGIAADTFSSMKNPVKIAYLESIGKTEPEIYQIMRNFVSDREARALTRTLLPAGDIADINLQKFKNAKGAIPMNGPKSKGTTAGERAANDFKQNMRIFGNTKALPAPAPRIITPNKQGTPNPIGRPYSPKEKGDVGGMRQRVSKSEKEMQTYKDSSQKRLFTNDIKSEPVVNKIKEPIKEKVETPEQRKVRISKMISEEKLKNKDKSDYLMKHGTMVGFGDKNPEKTISEFYSKKRSESSKKLSQEDLNHLFKKKSKK